MNRDATLVTADAAREHAHTIFEHHRLEEQYADLEQQHATASFGMWVFLATEVLFFGTLFLGLGVYRYWYSQAFEAGSARLNWIIGGTNTLVLLLSSLTAVLAVHYVRHGANRLVVRYLMFTALLGTCFLGLKAIEYYLDWRENLIPGWRFDADEWVTRDGLQPHQVREVQLFLLFYWVMTGFHALHVTIGIGVVLLMAWLARRGTFSADYYSPVDVTALYWHFVDIVWIFLLPMLYLLATRTSQDLHS